jgi:diguanylate cyclase (GGDEF)-like protein
MKRDKILIVDSAEFVRKTLFNCLSKECDVFMSESLPNALDIFRQNPFDIVVTELDLSGIQGIEVLRKFKEAKSDQTVIVITSYMSIPMAVEAMKEGAYDYITKPFNVDEIRMVILHALERQKLLEEVKEKEVYKELALIDELTRIYNRRYFEEILTREIDRAMRYPQKFSLLMTDIDDFKKYNDTYGHLAGDKILKEVAHILFYKSRKTDLAARFGGEEFVVITPHTDKEGASILAVRMLDLVSNRDYILDDSTETKVSISIGVATFPDDANNKEDLIKTSDKALYQAKKLGKNRICLFGKES